MERIKLKSKKKNRLAGDEMIYLKINDGLKRNPKKQIVMPYWS